MTAAGRNIVLFHLFLTATILGLPDRPGSKKLRRQTGRHLSLGPYHYMDDRRIGASRYWYRRSNRLNTLCP